MTENDFFTAVEEIKRSVHDLSLPGFQIGSHIGDWNLDAPALYPVYKVYLVIVVQYYQYIVYHELYILLYKSLIDYRQPKTLEQHYSFTHGICR